MIEDNGTKEKVVIIIPTYNEELVIENTIKQVFDATKTLVEYDVCVLIFDSASTDKTQLIVQSLLTTFPNQLYIQNEPQKTGLGSAYLKAMRHALDVLQADVVIEFDADLSHQPSYLVPMLTCLKQCDVVIGSRYVEGGSIPADWGMHRKCLSILGNYVARLVLTRRYNDFTSGFRATRRHVLSQVLPQQFLSNHYAYKLHLLWLLHKNKAVIKEIPIHFIDRSLGESKLPANSIIDSLRVIFTLRAYELQDYLKMCLVGLSGAILQLTMYNIIRLHLHPFYAIKISTIVAITNNFILNHRYTFKRRKRYQFKMNLLRFLLFLSYCFLIIQFQSYILELGMKYVGQGWFVESAILIVIIGFSSIINYFFSSRVVWRKDKSIS